ncbi:MAG: hypothetical protein H9855_00055 [Candidatus Acinetobacter avistercoris]|nr:hypothetical protein [Candidatus Acinetobacter avistercoris]
MKLYREADKIKTGCEHCKAKVDVTMTLCDMPFKHADGVAKDVLVGICDICGNIVVTPHQSTIKIGRDLKNIKKSIELRVPAHYIDILNLASNKVDVDLDESFNKHLILFYINLLNSTRYEDGDLFSLFENEDHNVKLSKRLSFKANDKLVFDIELLVKRYNFENKSDLLKAIILKINHDIVQSNNIERINELKVLAYSFFA